MAQHDYVIANGTGAAVRSDLNNALAAIVSQNSGATAPATTYAYQWWADTTTGLLKIRNAANNAWITLRELDGTLTIEDGTASSPGLAFADDLNTGIYSPSADQLGITTGGTVRLTTTTTGITSALPVDVPLGTASAPTVTFTGDLNTGIYSPGADQVAISTNGSGRLFVSSTGQIGIGGTPGAPLHVKPGSGDSYINVTSVTSSASVIFNDSGTGGNYPKVGSEGNSLVLRGGSLNNAVTIDSSQRVGIGSTSVSDNLHVSTGAANATTGITLSNTSEGEGYGAAITWRGRYGAPGTSENILASINGFVTSFNGAKQGNIAFSTGSGNSISERARIDSSGRLLVGTSSALGAAGGAGFQLVQANNSWIHYLANSASTGDVYGQYINFTNQAPNNTNSLFLYCGDSSAQRATIRSNGGLANFQANNVNLSDRNTKKDISPAANTWDCIKEWEIVNYRYKDQPDDADLNLGVIAQQVAESCPEVITVFEEAKDDQPEKLGIKEQQMYWMAIKALQEAQVRIEQLEARLTAAGIE